MLIYFVNASIIINKYILPFLLQMNGPKWSVCSVWKGISTFYIGCSKPSLEPPGALWYAHSRHADTYCLTKWRIFGNQNDSWMRYNVFSNSKCPALSWFIRNIVWSSVHLHPNPDFKRSVSGRAMRAKFFMNLLKKLASPINCLILCTFLKKQEQENSKWQQSSATPVESLFR